MQIWTPQAGVVPHCGSRYRVNPNNPVNRGLTTWLLMNESGGAKAFNVSPNMCYGGGNYADDRIAHGSGVLYGSSNFTQYAGFPAWKGTHADTKYIDIWPIGGYKYSFWNKANHSTVAIWFNTTTSDWNQLFTQSNKVPWFPRCSMTVLNNGKLNIYFCDNVGYERCNLTSTAAYNDGKWHCAVWRYNASTGVSEGFIDGVADAAMWVGTGAPNSYDFDTSVLGNLFCNNANYDPLDGYIANFQFWRRVLTAQEIMSIYLNPYGTPGNPRLLSTDAWAAGVG